MPSLMFASFLAAFFFALSATCANHSLRTFGSARANLGRLLVAAVVLAGFAHTLGNGFSSASTAWFFASGVIGMGLGDLGLFAALPFLGSRLTVLMTQCLAAPIAALGEWLWLGTTLTGAQMLWGFVILTGIAIALLPTRSSPPRVRLKPIGFVFGLVAAAGQGVGALFSRKGVEVAASAGEVVHTVTFGLNTAYFRILAGLLFTIAWFVVLHQLRRVPPKPAAGAAIDRRNGRLWVVANGLAGPVLGVGCYQWALATTPSGIVMPIAATTPLLAIPIAWWLERDRPSRRSLLGAAVAVAGCIALTAAR
jgi:drug/metabolite transporter (DMT)-like permease